MGWLGVKALGAPRWIWLAGVVLAFVAVVLVINHGVSSSIETISSTAKEAGAAQEQTKGLEKVLKATEEGNEARRVVEDQSVSGGGRELYDQCVSANRGAAEVCKRFLPQRPAADGQRGAGAGAERSGQSVR